MSNHLPVTNQLLIDRKKEVSNYLKFLEVAVRRPGSAVISNDGGNSNFSLSIELTHTLKANLLLLLYSAMEATLIQLLDEIHSAIEGNCQSVDQLNNKLFQLALETFQKESKKQSLLFSTTSPIHKSLFKNWINNWQSKTTAKEKRSGDISGSVDGKIFCEYLKKFGVINSVKDERPPHHLINQSMQAIKTRRNELAHGEKSFVDLGQSLSFEELEMDATSIFTTLNNITTEVEKYLEDKRYLAKINIEIQ